MKAEESHADLVIADTTSRSAGSSSKPDDFQKGFVLYKTYVHNRQILIHLLIFYYPDTYLAQNVGDVHRCQESTTVV